LGKPIPDNDLWIAAIARQHGYPWRRETRISPTCQDCRRSPGRAHQPINLFFGAAAAPSVPSFYPRRASGKGSRRRRSWSHGSRSSRGSAYLVLHFLTLSHPRHRPFRSCD
jgi:hypothetical protein